MCIYLAKKNIFFLMLNAGHPVCRSPIPFNQIVVDKRYITDFDIFGIDQGKENVLFMAGLH
jgi:hypothetical protein